MKCSRTLVSAYVVVTCCLHVCACVGDTENGFTKENMKTMVKSMLGFKTIPDSADAFSGKKEAPKYMLDLYERFKDRPISVGQTDSNTVRSIQARVEKVNGEEMFVFDLSSLTSTKQMISAEIHLYKRKRSKFNKNADLELNLYEIAPHHIVDRNSIQLNIASHGWQWYDVTDVVTRCVSKTRLGPHSLGINFKVTKSSGTSSTFDLRRFTQHHSSPYLIIYSNDADELDIENIDQPVDIAFTNTEEVTTKSDDVIIPQRNKRSLKDNSADLPIYPSRSRSLSILTNEIPEVPEEFRPYPHGINIKTHPGMLQTRKETRHRIADTKLIPYPLDNGNRRRRKKQRERRKKKGKKGRRNNKLDLPKKWDALEAMAHGDKSRDLCGRKKLILDFNDIGWGDWVISPKSFKAHYCAGRCPFPLTKKLRPTNHATIQSLVNTVNPNVPAPCCSPEKLSSITLLYFDENGNVVLKNYPDMTVQKCGCR